MSPESIRGANRAALKLLGYRNHEALCGQRIEAVLDTTLEALMHLSWRHGFRPDALPLAFRAAALVCIRAGAGGGAAPSDAQRESRAAAARRCERQPQCDRPARCPPHRLTRKAVMFSATPNAMRCVARSRPVTGTSVPPQCGCSFSRRTIYRKMYRHGIARHDSDDRSHIARKLSGRRHERFKAIYKFSVAAVRQH